MFENTKTATTTATGTEFVCWEEWLLLRQKSSQSSSTSSSSSFSELSEDQHSVSSSSDAEEEWEKMEDGYFSVLQFRKKGPKQQRKAAINKTMRKLKKYTKRPNKSH
eukprot:m.224985 g.224985  ORF g.224985 m.224985 type:complete len:107 (-) comp13857_c2_seq1:5142-5462(-)